MPNTQVGRKIAKGLESEPTIEGAEHGGGFGQGLRWESLSRSVSRKAPADRATHPQP
jgi:hypothetical protein